MVCARESWAARAAVWAIVLGLVCESALGREVKLVVHPQKVSAEAGEYALLPPAASLTEGDAVPLYERAVKALPDKKSDDQVRQYLKMGIDQMRADQVEKTLKQYVGSFKCVAQAVKCRECKWFASTPMTPDPMNLEPYCQLGSALRLWARYEIAQEDYEGAILAMQTGFGMSKHITQDPDLVHFLTGNAIAAMMCVVVGEFVQAGEAPNLHAALAALPKPFTDAEKVIEGAKRGASELLGQQAAKQVDIQLKASFDRTRILAKRLDTDLAALQCVEAIRSYAASHAGQLPQTLTEITEVPVPKDPVSGAAFRYSRTGATAVLESAMPSGGDAQDVIRYEITVKN
jgi:hypothetical protein